MPLFICRWQNGDFSAVSASSRDKAMALLDEVGDAERADLFIAEHFMVHFRLKTEPDNVEELLPVELEEFGEETHDLLCNRVYPVYSQVSMKVDRPTEGEVPKEQSDAAFKALNEALVEERTRNWPSEEPVFSTEPDGADFQKQAEATTSMAERAVKERSRRSLTEMPPRSDKVQ